MTNSNPLPFDTGRGFSLFWKNKWLYSKHDPLSSPKYLANNTEILPDTLYIVISPCLFYGVDDFAKKLPKSSQVLCIEADLQLLELAKQYNNSSILLCKPEEAIIELDRLQNSGFCFRKIRELCFSGGKSLFSEIYDSTIRILEENIAIFARNKVSLIFMGRLWTRNVLCNLRNIDFSKLTSLPNLLKPAIVCGAGPSLDIAIPYIKKLRQKLTVIACDTASGALYKQGIIPDIVVCLEAQIYNIKDFLPVADRSIHLVADISSHPATFNVFNGNFTLLSSEWTHCSFLTELYNTKLPIIKAESLGSVGVLALWVAKQYKKPFFITGLDFCFLKGKTHCAYSPAEIADTLKESRLVKSPRAWSATFREHTKRLPSGLIYDPSLSLYASLSRSIMEENEIFDLRGSNTYPLPAKQLELCNLESQIDIIQSQITTESLLKTNQEYDTQQNTQEACNFLSQANENAQKLEEALHTGTSKENLKDLLKKADFLYMHFPDPERVLALEEDALKRVAVEIVYWKKYLKD